MTTKNPYGKNYVDHFLQLSILEQLSRSKTPIKFSDLKSDDIENSLFMYHMNKLIKRGIVEKREQEGFALTPKGANWVNATGTAGLDVKLLPRPLVQFIILHDSKMLLSLRKGQLGEHLNKYLLPGGLHKYGLSADETADKLLQHFFPKVDDHLAPSFTCLAEMIVKNDDDVHHAISHIFSIRTTTEILPADDPLFDYAWVDLDSILHNETYQDETILLQLVQKIKNGSLQQRELLLG